MEIVKNNEELVEVSSGRCMTSSLKVAEAFRKEHSNVLQSLRNLECSQEFNRLNFQETSVPDVQGRNQPVFNMTRDGFMLLVMGFTGKKAMQCKEKYIEAFNIMEKHIKETSLVHYSKIDNAIALLTELAADNKYRVQLVSDKVDNVSVEVTEIKRDVRGLNDKIIELGRTSNRKDVSNKNKKTHRVFVKEMLGWKCPCCLQSLDNGFEYDHFHANYMNELGHTWLICKDCHEKLTRNKLSRTDAWNDFTFYQKKLKSYLDRQLSIFDVRVA
jgi:Rha family phage regulatory protein